MNPYREVHASSEPDAEPFGSSGVLDDCVVLGVLLATGLLVLGGALGGEPSPVAAVFGLLLVASSLWSFARDVLGRETRPGRH